MAVAPTVLAELLERTAEAGAKVIVLDVLLAETSEADAKLQSAMDGSASVVLAYHGAGARLFIPTGHSCHILPLPMEMYWLIPMA